MKVLLMAPRVPTVHPDGLTLVVQNILPSLRETCELVLCGLHKPVDAIPSKRGGEWMHFSAAAPSVTTWRHLSPRPASLPTMYPGSELWVDALLYRERPDVIMVFGANMATMIEHMSRKAPTLYAPLDSSIRHHRMLSACTSGRIRRYHELQALKWRWYEPYVVRRSTATVYVSPFDAAVVAKSAGDNNIHIIPNGVDVDADVFPHRAPVAKQYDIALSGNFDYQPNVDGLLHFLHDIRPQFSQMTARSSILVVGKCTDTNLMHNIANIKGVSCFWNVDDVNSFITQARMFVCPVRFGTGIRNGVLQAMASRLPIVTYPINTEALRDFGKQLCFEASDAAAFAEAIDRSLRKSHWELAAAGERGHDYILSEHRWGSVGAQYLKVIKHIHS